jgi:hypothetical protein
MAAVRASLRLRLGNAEDLEAAEAWLETWRASLVYLSADYGCVCCCSEFDVEGSAEAIAAIPPNLRADSAWTSGEGASPQPPVIADRPFWKASKLVAEMASRRRKRF